MNDLDSVARSNRKQFTFISMKKLPPEMPTRSKNENAHLRKPLKIAILKAWFFNYSVELSEILSNNRPWSDLFADGFGLTRFCLWRHLGAILWKHITDRIFIMKGNFL